MGFSASGATAIIFVGLLVSAATLVPAVEDAREARTDGLESRDDRMLETQNTQFEIIEAVYDDQNDTLAVRIDNTGATTLDANGTDLVVDGRYVLADRGVEADSSRHLWTPGTELRFVYDTTTRPNRVLVATRPGIQRTANVTDGTVPEGVF
jgi:flagellar protein FlaF